MSRLGDHHLVFFVFVKELTLFALMVVVLSGEARLADRTKDCPRSDFCCLIRFAKTIDEYYPFDTGALAGNFYATPASDVSSGRCCVMGMGFILRAPAHPVSCLVEIRLFEWGSVIAACVDQPDLPVVCALLLKVELISAPPAKFASRGLNDLADLN